MINGKRILGVIPARGGSKGIPRKNIKELAGKPLIAWTIEEASKSKYIDRCIVSTDDDEIMEIARAWGGDVPFKRPAELAKDNTPGVAPVLHAMKAFPEYDYIVLLQVTSPLRIVADIDGCIEFCFSNSADSCVSISEATSNPYWMLLMNDRKQIKPLLQISDEESYQRQKLPKVYQYNGAVYVASYEFLKKFHDFISMETIGYVMSRKRSYDIDTLDDFHMVEMLKMS